MKTSRVNIRKKHRLRFHELEKIYPTASKKSKEDEAYKEAAMQATYELQNGRKGYQALLSHILNVSVTDLKKIMRI